MQHQSIPATSKVIINMNTLALSRSCMVVALLVTISSMSAFSQDMFGTTVSYYPVGDLPASVFSIDFDSDGNNDLATANYTSGDVSVLLGNGDGT
ncbi:MAG: hypothetical protein KAT79_02325, partial [candidate division Zixibacteria bacterium]|nr:hypothetical protein [candidate division Zixibacteria bacterium]